MSWLTELRAGDEVITGHKLSRVEKITPTGRIRVAGAYYNPDTGYAIGTWYAAARIEEATEKRKEFVRELEIKTKAYRLMAEFKPREDRIDVETAEKIIAILEPLSQKGDKHG